MSTIVPECPACRVRMDEGVVFETVQHGQKPLLWCEGRPEKGRFGRSRPSGQRKLELVSYRCPRCGWVIWFAPVPAEAQS